jgi:dsDNA-specific endonuclease/ATPase MutS2
MSNHEIVSLQLQKCEDVIHNALKAKIRKLVIIHGKGQGVLRQEVHQLLQSFRLDYKDADYLKYSGGATDVFFR